MTRPSPIIWRRPRLAALALCMATALAPSHASAFELFGIHLWGPKAPEETDVIGDPQLYEVEFAVAETEDGIEAKLKAASNLWGDRDEAASGAAGLISKARGDYRRLLATLYSEGRYGGSISILIDGREAADLAPDATIADPAAVAVTIDPGPLFHFRDASIANAAPPTEDLSDEVALPAAEGFAPGEVARSGVILQTENLAIEAWRQQGHAKAAIADRKVEAAHDADVVDVRITVDPGRKAYYGPVTVEGAERMDAGWVAWMTGLRPGDEYDPHDLKRANTRIARLDVFRAARFQEAEMIGDDGLLPITYIVQERLPRRFGVGATYSTVDGGGVEAFWLHRNLFGRAERLKFEGKVANIGKTFKPEEFTYRIGATFVKPGIYTPDTDFTASLFGDREVLDAYTRTAVTGTAGFTHIFNDRLSGKLFATGGHAQFKDAEFGTRDFSTIGLAGTLTYDSRDNPADATRGFLLEATLEPFYEFQYANFAYKGTAEARGYLGFGDEGRFVLAGRVKVGSISGAPISELPPDRLFFAGGGGSVRGYGYRNIGVPTFNEDLRVGVGAGLRYITGLGPIRLDVAVPLDRRENDPSVAVYVGIGQAF